MTIDDVRLAAQKADLIRIETDRIEGSLRAIRDVAGPQAVLSAADAAAKRVIRANMNDSDGWVA